MTLSTTVAIVSDPEIADGEMRGFDADGNLIVSMRYMPVFERLVGTQDDEREVARWHMSPAGVCRIAAIRAWNRSKNDHPTAGSA